MWVKGQIVKRGKFWVVNIPAVDYATQGRTKREAYGMAKDLLETLADSAGFQINVTIEPASGDEFYATGDNPRAFTAIVLRYWRVAHNMTLREAAGRLGAKSASAYARYEQGKSDPTITMMDKLVSAVGVEDSLVVKFGGRAGVA